MRSLHARAEAMRARVLVRAWELRQLSGAKGSWFRLRRMLVRARAAYAVDADTMDALLAEGFPAAPVGAELEPPRRYVFVPADRAERITSRRALEIRLSAGFLTSADVVLVAFPGA